MTMCNTDIILKVNLVHVYVFLFFCLGLVPWFCKACWWFCFYEKSVCWGEDGCVCSGEVLSRFLLWFLLLLLEISLSLHTMRSLYKYFIFLFICWLQCFDWQVPTLTILFLFCFLHCFLWIKFTFSHTFKKFDLQMIQYRCCITT